MRTVRETTLCREMIHVVFAETYSGSCSEYFPLLSGLYFFIVRDTTSIYVLFAFALWPAGT
jgi:hypothetical protein